jgi:hypothetical protein
LRLSLPMTLFLKAYLAQPYKKMVSGNILIKLQRSTDAISAYNNAYVLFRAMGLERQVGECREAIERIERSKMNE